MTAVETLLAHFKTPEQTEPVQTADYFKNQDAKIQEAAYHEGQRRVYAMLRENSDEDALDVLMAIYDLLVQGPDDTWSGRSGDIKRSYFDGVRQGARDVRYALAADVKSAIEGS